MRIEGNHRPGNSLMGDDRPVPFFCPECGRSLTGWSWDFAGAIEYPYLVCYGGKWRWVVWLNRRLFSVISPTGAHYAYMLPSIDLKKNPPPDGFDRWSGRPLR